MARAAQARAVAVGATRGTGPARASAPGACPGIRRAPADASLQNGFGQQVDLGRIGRRREQHELVAASLFECSHTVLDRLGVSGHAGRHLLGEVADECVVIGDVAVDLFAGALAKAEVAECRLARLTRATGLRPRRVQLLDLARKTLGRASAHHPAAVARGALERDIGAAADHHFRAAVAGLRPDAAGEPDLFAAPEAGHLVELAIEGRPTLAEVQAAGLKVVVAPADREAEREPPSGEDVD